MKISRRIIFVFVLCSFFVLISSSKYEPTDPTTWAPNELKEWLAEHRITYKGIPEKQELVDLVKANWQDVKDRASTTSEAVDSFVTKYIDIVKDNYQDAEKKGQENYDEFLQEVAIQVESVRQATGLTEEQTESTINEIAKKLKETKAKGDENLARALNEIKESYKMAGVRRDVLIQKTANRVQDDLINSGIISQETLDWFKDEVNKMSEAPAFAKARTETQASLILQGVQEQLTKRKVHTVDQINSTYEKLSSVAEQYYQSINGTLARLRYDLTKTIGGTSEYIIDELRSQLSTVNDYRLLTQEKIQGSIDAIGQKLSDGKTLTVEQLQQIRVAINNYFTTIKGYYNSATSQVKQTTFETKRSQEERVNNIIEAVRSSVINAKDKSDQQVSKIIQTIEEDIGATQQLTAEQTKILSETIQEQFGNLKKGRDITEDKITSFADALRIRMEAIRQFAADVYDNTTDKLTTEKEKLTHQKDEL